MTEPKQRYDAGEVKAAIQFWAVVYKVQTLSDHGIRLTLDMPEDAVMTMAELVECKRRGIVLSFTAGALINNKETTSAISTRSKRKSSWQTKETKSADNNS
jgi:hypothetical protein